MDKITLRDIEDNDIELLTNWLNKEYILKWYHDASDWLYEINERHNTFSWINHFIVMYNDIPIGFCQYYDCYDGKEFEDWYTVNEPNNTYSIDYLIGNEEYLGKGYGKSIIKALTEYIIIAENAYKIIVQPDDDNFASKAVLLSNGYLYDNERKYYYKVL